MNKKEILEELYAKSGARAARPAPRSSPPRSARERARRAGLAGGRGRAKKGGTR